MRVGLAIETDSPGGAESMLLQLGRELQLRGHTVVALGPTGGQGWLTARFAELGIERDLVEFRGLYGLGGVAKIAATIRDRRLDVLHSHEFGMSVPGALAARLTGCRHVITMHGGSYWGERLRRRMALRWAGRLSHHTVAVSEAFRRTLATTIGASPESVQVVLNGVSAVAGVGGRVREELGLGPDHILVLAVGNLLPVKGHAILLEALSLLSKRIPNVVVAIAGHGPEEPSLRALATRLEIEGAVRFLGYRADVPDLLADASVFVMPSVLEGLPMAVIEAMLAGKAIVASDVGGMKELIPDPAFGLLVPPGDAAALSGALAKVIGDAPMRERMGAAARARAMACFTASTMADRYLALYSD